VCVCVYSCVKEKEGESVCVTKGECSRVATEEAAAAILAAAGGTVCVCVRVCVFVCER